MDSYCRLVEKPKNDKVCEKIYIASKSMVRQTKDKKLLLSDEYYECYETYKSQYEKVAVLMQCGGFFELYSPHDYSRGNAKEIAAILNCELTEKNPNKDNSVLMAGFPLRSIEKNVSRLVHKGYTVVVVEQCGDNMDDSKMRKTTQVVSQGNLFDNSRLRNYTMSIHYQDFGKDMFLLGIAFIDTLINDKITVHEVSATSLDSGLAFDTAVKFISQYDPVDCIIITQNGQSTKRLEKEIPDYCHVYKRDIQTVIASTSNLPVLDLSTTVQTAVNALKGFMAEHHVDLCNSPIEVYRSEMYMDLCTTAIGQLDIPLFLSKKELNMTATSMGDRLLFEKLCSPFVDKKEIEKSYDDIDAMSKEQADKTYELLCGISDLDRLTRKMSVGMLSWSQWRLMHKNFEKLHGHLSEEFKDLTNDYGLSLDLNSPTEIGMFKKNQFENVDKLRGEYMNAATKVEESVKMVNETVPECAPYKVKDQAGIQMTHVKANLLKTKSPGWHVQKFTSYSVVYTDDLRDFLIQLKHHEDSLTTLVKSHFEAFQKKFYGKWRSTLLQCVRDIAKLDVVQASRRMAFRYKLVRPTVVEEKRLDIRELRHLLIENINPNVKYVPNDCTLSANGTIGSLLYGVNSCGKTSYLKSIGLAVIFAQAGMFVPAESMSFKPLKRIITRIAGGDSIQKSSSSFIVELDELKSIITRGDADTLILGDEMCRGTENKSANAIVYSTLSHMVKQKSFFVSATHLHGLVEPVETNFNSQIQIMHMKVYFESDEALFDRKLHAGSGPKLYGIEIAKALNFPADFLKAAMEFRNDEIVQKEETVVKAKAVVEKKSRYNNKKILVYCELCLYKPSTPMELPLDTHHLEWQCNAVNDYNGNQHKNSLHNLIALCKQCHVDVHRDKVKIQIVQTLQGRKVRKIVDNKRDDITALSESIVACQP